MSIDLTGIGNRNEYYTNHYFSTMFEDGASERIKQWTEESKNQETKTPWAMLRENAKQYYPIHDRYDRGQPHLTTASNIINMAAQYLESMGYGTVNSVTINVMSFKYLYFMRKSSLIKRRCFGQSLLIQGIRTAASWKTVSLISMLQTMMC